jgi:hypothetical protein
MISLFDLTYFSIAICYLIITLFLQLLFARKNMLVAGAILTHVLLFLCSDLVCCLVFFYTHKANDAASPCLRLVLEDQA